MTPADTAATNLLLARIQMAFTLGFHIIYASLGIGMPLMMLTAEWRFLRTGDRVWRELARRWSQAFAVLFAVGAVSGTVLSFELGLLWPGFMARYGAVIALPFTLEGFAFFVEAVFLGIYLYSWDRLSPRSHFYSGIPVALGGALSGFLVVTANAWMNAPQGFRLEDGKVADAEPFRAMFNPAWWTEVSHTLLSTYMVAGFMLATVYAAFVLRGRAGTYRRRALALGLTLGCVLAPLQALVGDIAGQFVARTQPAKFAAMEGQYRTQAGAPLRIGGWPDERARRTRWAVEIPYGLSLLGFRDPKAVVRGLDDFPAGERPRSPLVHFAFDAMVGTGFALVLLGLWALAGWLRRRTLPRSRAFLWAALASGPLAIIAMETGWIVTEVGRQPWIVRGFMKVEEAVTDAPGMPWLFAVTLVVYAVLAAGTVVALRMIARTPLSREARRGP